MKKGDNALKWIPPSLADRLRGLKTLVENKKFTLGLMILLGTWLTSAIGYYMTPYDPYTCGRFLLNLPPSSEHPLGTDGLGRDILAQLFLGAHQSFEVMFLAGAFGIALGAILGLVIGYYRGALDSIVRSIVDVFLVIPMLPMLILVSSFVRVISIPIMAIILSVFAWAWPARAIRSQVLSVRERPFVDLARLTGMSKIEIVFREIAPNMIPFIGANFISTVATAAMAQIGIELLGLGPQHTVTLGTMIYWAMFNSAIFRGMWWWWSPPIIVLVLAFTSLFLIHSGLDEIANPRLREIG